MVTVLLHAGYRAWRCGTDTTQEVVVVAVAAGGGGGRGPEQWARVSECTWRGLKGPKWICDWTL